MSFRQIKIQHFESSVIPMWKFSRAQGRLGCYSVFCVNDPVRTVSYSNTSRRGALISISVRLPQFTHYSSGKITHFGQSVTKEMKWSKMTTYLSDRGFPFVFWSFEYKDRLSSLFAILVDCLDAPSPWSFVWLDILWDGLCESVGLKKYYCFCLFINLFLFCWRCWVRNIPDFATGSIAIADMLD